MREHSSTFADLPKFYRTNRPPTFHPHSRRNHQGTDCAFRMSAMQAAMQTRRNVTFYKRLKQASTLFVWVPLSIRQYRRSRISTIGGFSSNNVVKKLASAFSLYLLMWGQAALAATYNQTISGTHLGNIILTAGDPGAPSIVTAASGTFDGQAVTGVSPVGTCYADNIINVGGTLGYVSTNGITITYGTGTDNINLFSNNMFVGKGPIDTASTCLINDEIITSFSIISDTLVPTLSYWALFLTAGLLGMFALILL